MQISKCKEAIEAWTKVKDQATIDIEQAELYISALKAEIKTQEKQVK
jgi:hypothetical protein